MLIQVHGVALLCEGGCGRRIEFDDPVILWRRGHFHVGCLVRVLRLRLTMRRVAARATA